MAEQAATLEVQLDIDADADAEELDELTKNLRRELLHLEVDAVEQPRIGEPPPGARAAEAVELGNLLVTLAPVFLGPVVETIRSWLSRAQIEAQSCSSTTR